MERLQPSRLLLDGRSHSGVAPLAHHPGTFHFSEHWERLWARAINIHVTEGEATVHSSSPWYPQRLPWATKPHDVATEKKPSSWCLGTGGSGHPTQLLGSCAAKRGEHVLRKAALQRVVLVYSIGPGAWGSPGLPAGSGLSSPVMFLAYKCVLLLGQICLLWQYAALLVNNVTAILTWSSSLQIEETLIIEQ